MVFTSQKMNKGNCTPMAGRRVSGLNIYESIELFLAVPGRKIVLRSNGEKSIISLWGVDGSLVASARFGCKETLRYKMKRMLDEIITND